MNRPKKTIFINRFFYPDHAATSQILSDLAFHLVWGGEELHIITSWLRYDDPTALLPRHQIIKGVVVHRIRTSRFGRAFLPGRAIDYLTFHLGTLIKLFFMARRGDLLVAKTDPPLISVTVLPVVWLYQLKLVNWVQDLFPEVADALGIGGGNKMLIGFLCWLRNRSLKTAVANVALGTRMAARLRQQGVAEERIQIIHNWSDGSAITPIEPNENSLRHEWGLSDRFVVGYSGNLGRAHDFETVLEAARLLQEQQKIIFLFIGGGAGLEKVRKRVQKMGLTNVRFQPYQPRERLAHSLGVPDLHWMTLLPVLEGLIVPSKFYGIAAAGRPLVHVGDPHGEIPDLIKTGGCGFTVVPGAFRQLAGWIDQLASDPVRCQQMGAQARQLFEDRFDQPIAMAAWSKLLQTADQS